MRQSRVRAERRRPYMTSMKTHLRRIRDAAKAGKNDEVVKLLPAAYKAIDTAAKKRLINRKNADRKKSAIALLIKRGS